jgi:hypothetical protein
MTVNEKLLKDARAAGSRLAGAEREVQLARAEYHAIVRRMHLAGGSLREIAEMLALSHQRVQQMVQGAGGSWWQRIWRHRNLKGNLICSFCRRPQSEVAKLIAGPKVYICDTCIAAAEQSMTPSPAPALPGSLALAKEGSKAQCSFCRKGRTADRALLTGSAGNICGECLRVCRQILTDSSV